MEFNNIIMNNNNNMNMNNNNGPRFDQSDFPALGGANNNNQQQQQAISSYNIPYLNDDGQFPALSSNSNNNSKKSSMNNNDNNNNYSNNDFAKNHMIHERISGGPVNIQRSSSTPPPQQTSINNTNSQNNLQNNSNQNNSNQNINNNNNNNNNNLNSSENNEINAFGLDGLLDIIAQNGSAINTLSLGMDLTTLGMNPAQKEVLYAKFAYPTSDKPMRHKADYVLPYCYYMQPPPLKTSHLSKFKLETLFYIFYNMPKDTLQVYAAIELYKREWRYHQASMRWVHKLSDNNSQNRQFLQETWEYFNVSNWKTEAFVPPQMSNWANQLMPQEELSLTNKSNQQQQQQQQQPSSSS